MIIIPARINSHRVKNKMLRKIKGKPVIQHTVENALKSEIDRIIVATDSDIIAGMDFDSRVEIVNTKNIICENGTERCAYIATKLKLSNSDSIINVQGDNWNVNPDAIKKVNYLLDNIPVYNKHRAMISMYEDITDKEMHDESVIKVIINRNNKALFFTRYPITFAKKHCGIYGYNVSFLTYYKAWKNKSLEKSESLEQMRTLENDGIVYCYEFNDKAGDSINTEHDLLVANSG